MEAVEKQDIEWLASHPEELQTIFANGQTLLILACEKGKERVVDFLLQQDRLLLDVNATDRYKWSALFYACNRGHEEIVKSLLAHPDIDPNLSNEYQNTPLICACDKGFIRIAELLLAHPAIDIHRQDDLGLTAIMWASYRENQPLVKRIMQHSKLHPQRLLHPVLEFPKKHKPTTTIVIKPIHPNHMMFHRIENQFFKLVEHSIPLFKRIQKNMERYKTKLKKIIEILKE